MKFEPIGMDACLPDGYKPITKEDAIELLINNINKSIKYYSLDEDAKEAIAEKNKTRKRNPFPVLMRQGKKTIVLKYSRFRIEGFHLNGAKPQECLEWIRDVWLQDEANQEHCWKRHQYMTAKLRKKEEAS